MYPGSQLIVVLVGRSPSAVSSHWFIATCWKKVLLTLLTMLICCPWQTDNNVRAPKRLYEVKHHATHLSQQENNDMRLWAAASESQLKSVYKQRCKWRDAGKHKASLEGVGPAHATGTTTPGSTSLRSTGPSAFSCDLSHFFTSYNVWVWNEGKKVQLSLLKQFFPVYVHNYCTCVQISIATDLAVWRNE